MVLAFLYFSFIWLNLISALRRAIVRGHAEPEICGNHIKGDKPLDVGISLAVGKKNQLPLTELVRYRGEYAHQLNARIYPQFCFHFLIFPDMGNSKCTSM